MTEAKSKGQQRRIDIQRAYGEIARDAARRIKDKNAWSEINDGRPLNVPEIAIIIQEEMECMRLQEEIVILRKGYIL